MTVVGAHHQLGCDRAVATLERRALTGCDVRLGPVLVTLRGMEGTGWGLCGPIEPHVACMVWR